MSCKQTNEGFMFLKGSHKETIDFKSIPPKAKDRRRKVKIDKNEILQKKLSSFQAILCSGVCYWWSCKWYSLMENER